MFCACAAPASASSNAPAMRMTVFMSPPIGMSCFLSFDAETGKRLAAPSLRIAPDLSVQTAAVAVHRHHQRTEAAHAEFPQRFRVQVIQVHILDRLDPGGLECRGAPDNGEIRAAQ